MVLNPRAPLNVKSLECPSPCRPFTIRTPVDLHNDKSLLELELELEVWSQNKFLSYIIAKCYLRLCRQLTNVFPYASIRPKFLYHTCVLYYLCDKPMLYHTGLYQTLPVGTTFDAVPRFNTLMTLLSRSIANLLLKLIIIFLKV